ncbi:hypothetical protein FCOIX_7971 [Fusarium coicis]|nr:hypothetical protein FCOIX_7971 [Fusarium coicis]
MDNAIIKSFHNLSVQHPNFGVSPKYWTSDHLWILGIDFSEIQYTDPPVVSFDFDAKVAKILGVTAKKLAIGNISESKAFWVELLLLRNGGSVISSMSERLYFKYGERQVRLIKAEVSIFRIKEELSIPHVDPIMGYYRYNADEQRRKRFTAPAAPGGLDNSMVQGKYDIKIRKVTPEDWSHDPYLLAIILSLAQLQQRKSYGPRGLYLVRLLVTNTEEPYYAYVYKVDVPYQLLESLRCPTRTIEDFEFPQVKYVKVPFEPYKTFSERVLFHLAGAEYSPRSRLIGSTMGPSSPRGTKRKRDEE